ncbi:MAG: hypothetical protein ACOCUT_02685, partial [bacterium]
MKVIQPKKITTPHGTIGIFNPEKTTNCNYVISFPGYIGDALSHENFIKSTFKNNIGVIAITIKYGQSVKKMMERSESLFEILEKSHLSPQSIKYLRAISFGCFLSLPWMTKLSSQLEKIALITPCSGEQLPSATEKLAIPTNY